MTEEDEINIELYLKGKMSGEEVENFNQRLKNDKKFFEDYQNAISAHNLIKEAGRMELRQMLDTFEKSSKKTPKRVLPKRRTYLIAASILFLLGFYFMADYYGSKSPLQVYESYFESYPAPSTLRNNPTEETPYWDAAVDYYTNGNFEEALLNFERSESSISRDKVEFYKSICHLQLDDKYLNTTLHSLRKVSNGESNYKEQALWYFALGSLKNGNKQEAIKSFEKIIENQTFGYQQANEILKLNIKN